MQEAIIFPFLMTHAEATKRKEKQQQQLEKHKAPPEEQAVLDQKTQKYLANFWHWKASQEALPTLLSHLTQ